MPDFSTHPVSAIALSPSSRQLAAAADQSYLALHTLPPHDPPTPLSHQSLPRATALHQALSLTCLAFPSETTIYTADAKGAFSRYNTSPKLSLAYSVPAAHGGDDVTGIAALSESSLIATSGRDGTVRCWDPETRVCVAKLTGHRYETRAVALASSYEADVPVTIVASAGRDKTVRLWDVRASATTPIHTFTGHSGWVHDVALLSSPSPLLLSCAGDKTVRVWDLATLSERHVFRGHEYRVWGVAAASDGSFALSGSTDTTLRAWKLTDDDAGTCHVYEGHNDSVVAVAVSRNSDFAVTGCEDGTVFMWDCATLFGRTPVEQSLIELDDNMPAAKPKPSVPKTLDTEPLVVEKIPMEPVSMHTEEPLPSLEPEVPLSIPKPQSPPVEQQLALPEATEQMPSDDTFNVESTPEHPDALESKAVTEVDSDKPEEQSVLDRGAMEITLATVEDPHSIAQNNTLPSALTPKSITAELQAALSVTTDQLPSYDKSAAELVTALQRIRDLEQSLSDAKENDKSRAQQITSLTEALANRDEEITILKAKLETAEKLTKAANVKAALDREPRKVDVSLDFEEPVNKIGAVSDQLGALAARLDAMIATN